MRRNEIAAIVALAAATGLIAADAAGLARGEPPPRAGSPTPAACTAHSGARSAALIELYTSQGCSSCPPADRWLSSLPAQWNGVPIVPIALHVSYWDAIGWKDPFARDAFNERQRRVAARHTAAGARPLVYTPGVYLDGREWPSWSSASDAKARIAALASRTPLATIEARAALDAAGQAVYAQIDWRAAPGERDASLYVAITQDGYATRVRAGENRGATLANDHVVRDWSGPHRHDGRALDVRLVLPEPIGARPATLVAFVQRDGDGTVLQALGMPLQACVTETGPDAPARTGTR